MKISAPIYTSISKSSSTSTPISSKNYKKPKEHAQIIATKEVKPVSWVSFQGYLPIKTAPQYIDFEPSKDIEQAKNFAKDNLGINFFGIDNLDCANYINEALSKYYNNSADKSIVITSYIPSFRYLAALTGEHLEFSQRTEEILKSAIERYKTKKGFELLKNQNLAEFGNLTKSQMKYLNYFQNGIYDELSLKEKIGYTMFLRGFSRDIIPLTVNGKLSLPDGGDFWVINHEIGHAKHAKNIGSAEFKKMRDGFSIDKSSNEDLVHRFKAIEPDWQVTQKVSDYAAKSPVEFVAEVYACLLNGYKFDDDVMLLYRKYGGPKIT